MRRRWCIGLILLLGCEGTLTSTAGRGRSDSGSRALHDAGRRAASPDGAAISSSPDASAPFEDPSLSDAGAPADMGPPPADAGPPSVDPMTDIVGCAMTPPAGSPTPPPTPTYAGACPGLVAGHNLITSSGSTRDFRLVVPAGYDPSRSYPLFFLWHWLRGSADSFYSEGDVQSAADTQHFIAVIPEAKGDLSYTWPFTVIDSSSRINEDLQLFDDMLACVSAQYSINNACVTSVGVSAGALWTDQLAGARGQYLSSFISLSGGTGGYVRPWSGSAHRMAALVLWGGPTDMCVVDMNAASLNLEAGLTAGGNFLVECVHNCGHSTPPIVGTPSLLAPLWKFVLQHPYWLPAGTSPFQTTGLPSDFPEWCGIAAGGATIRVGACSPSRC